MSVDELLERWRLIGEPLYPVPFAMWHKLGRRVSMIMLIVAVATSFGMLTVQAKSHHGQMAASVTMDADHLAGCAHDGCPIDQNVDMHGTCSAVCAGVGVMAPTTAIFNFTAEREILTPSLEFATVDRTVAPDPHPPKHII